MNGREITEDEISAAMLEGAAELKAKARRASLGTAKNLNRHLPDEHKRKDTDLEEEVYAWFCDLDFSDLNVVRAVVPGKELLKVVLQKISDGEEVKITRGHLVACVSEEDIPEDLKAVIGQLDGGGA